MPVGVVVNALAVIFGGLLGAILANKVPERLRTALPLTFGVASMAMGIVYIVDMNVLPVVVLSLLLGSIFGELAKLEKGIEWCVNKVRKPFLSLGSNQKSLDNEQAFMEKFVAILTLFTASGTGIFGAMREGMTGDYSVLFAKAALDFFTAGIFATTLGFIVITIAVPQFVVLFTLFMTASFILPMTTPSMLADFSAVGGIIMLATGFRICGIKSFPVANMLPALLLAMPISYIWTLLIN